MDIQNIDIIPDTLSLDTNELDDEEYNIPSVDELPTLESILNEDEGASLTDFELSDLLPSLVTYNETGSVSNCSLQSSNSTLAPGNYKYDPGSILQYTILKAISAQLRSACERVDAGFPSVMCVSNMIAIGTSHGHVLVFDSMQTLRWYYQADVDQTSVSSLCFNYDCSRLLAGFARGLILMFDVTDGKLLRTMNDVHSASTAVLHLKFTDLPTLAICGDSGGSVFELNFKRSLGVRSVETKCIFSGSRGEVCCMEPLLLRQFNSHPLFGVVLVAMATLTKLIVVTIRPRTKLLYSNEVLSHDKYTLPLLSWQFVIVQLSETNRTMDPVLAFAKGRTIYFFQIMSAKEGRKLRCCPLQKVDVEYSLLSCHWLNTRTIALLDTKEQLHLLHVRNKEELETIPLSNIDLIYNTSHFKGIATGGNVSKAMELSSERACYNTVQGYGNQVLFLGLRGVHVISIRNWIERLDTLVDKGRFEDALRLGMEFLEERGKMILGLKGPHHQRYSLVKEKIVDILNTYIDLILNGGYSTVSLIDSITTIIDMCIKLNHSDILFERLWEGIDYNGNEICRDACLSGISVAVLQGKLKFIPPALSQQLLYHLAQLQQWKDIEDCILTINIECLDIEQAFNMCRKHNLYDGLISLWNRAMQDYTSPLTELFPKFQKALDSCVMEESREIGNKLLVYISYCFGGIGYPRGEIDDKLIDTIRTQVFQIICNQHTINASDNEPMYPHLRALMKFDMKEFLNVLSMAFSDQHFSFQFKQRLVDLLQVVVFHDQQFQVHEIAWLFVFLRTLVDNPGRPITIEKEKFRNILEMLVKEEDTDNHNQRQHVFAELVNVDNFQYFKIDDVLKLAKKAKFYQVCVKIHEIREEHGEVLKCYLLDNHRRFEVFEYLSCSSHKDVLRPHFIQHFKALSDINSEKTGEILGKYYPELMEEIKMDLSDRQLYYLLKGALGYMSLSNEMITRLMHLYCLNSNEEQVLQFVKKHTNLILDKCITYAKNAKMNKVLAMLLERQGDYQGAFNVLFNSLKDNIEKNENVDEAMEDIINLSHRASCVIPTKTTWLPLLQYLLDINSHELVKQVLANADVNLATELHLLLQHGSGTLGDFRNLIIGLMDKCYYEYSMQKSVMRVVYRDLHEQLAKAVADSRKGINAPMYCFICNEILSDTFLLFRCGHGYHKTCLGTSNNRCVACV